MSLINSAHDVLRTGIREGVKYRAIVIDNDDPKKLCRIKFKIPKFFEFETSVSPWAICSDNGADGSGKNFGTINIPRKDSYVDIEFIGGSVYHPRYYSSSMFSSVQPTDVGIHYPDRKIIRLSNGVFVIIDENDNMINIFNPGATNIDTGDAIGISTPSTIAISPDGGLVVYVKEGDEIGRAHV